MAVRRKPPTPIAATGTTTIYRDVVGDEYVTALADIQARMRIYTRMRRGDGAVNTSLLALEKPILGARWDIDGDDEIAKAARAEFFDSDQAEAHDPSIFELALGHLVTMFQYGFAAAEPQWGIGADGRVHCETLTLIRQESVRTFRLAANSSRLESLVQYAQQVDGMTGDIVIPVAQLLLAVHQREGADYSGVSLIRSSYRAYLERDTIRKTRLWHHDRFGAGTPTAVYPESAGDQVKSEIDAALEAWRSGSQTYLALPFGTVLQIHGGTVTGDPTAELAALAAEIAKNTLSQMTELGTAGNTGNRALGGSFAELLRTALQGHAEYLGKIIRRQLLTPWVRWNYGEAAEVPQLSVRVSLGGVMELLAAITVAKGAGLNLEPEDMVAIRDELELPEIALEELQQRMEARRALAPPAGAPGNPGDPNDPAAKQGAPPPDEDEEEEPTTLAEQRARGLYISRPVANAGRLARWFAEQPAFAGRTLDSDLHCTQMYSTTPVPDVEPSWYIQSARVTSTGILGDDRAFVLFLDAPDLHERYAELLAAGATPTYEGYRPHVTLFYLEPDEAPPADVTLPGFEIVLGDERMKALELAESTTAPEELAPDYLGRMRRARVVALEQAFLRPQLLAERLDVETTRAAADVHDVLREIDRALVDQVEALAAEGGEAVVRGAGRIEAPARLVKRLQQAMTAAARRAQAIGAESVRDELARQGAPAPTAGRALMERVTAPLRRLLADEAVFGSLAAMLTALLTLSAKREIGQRVSAAQQAALEAVVAAAAGGATVVGGVGLDARALAQRVADALAGRSRAAVEARVSEVINVSFGQGRRVAARAVGGDIERQIRSEALDAHTCDHCAAHDGDDFAFGDPSAPELPDPECDGGYRCRGVWMYKLADQAA